MPFVEVGEVRLYYELHGPPQAPILVLNNGLIMNAATSWVHQVADLSRHYRLLLYDCRGQGQSDHPEGPYSMALHARDLAGLLDALGVEKAHVAGISYGGEVAQQFALDFPQRVLSLVLADTVSEVRPALRLVVEGWMRAAQAGDAAAFFEQTVPWNFSPEFIARNPELIREARERYEALDLAAVARLCRSFLELHLTPRLAEIASPTCILVGENDRLKGPEYARLLHREIEGSELHVLEGAGHATCWERAGAFNTVILGFLAKQGYG